jgi:hypothetical protein
MSSDLMKIWAFCVFMPQKLQDMSSFLGFGGNSALLPTVVASSKMTS